MVSLTQTAIITRKVIRYSVYLVIFVLIARTTIKTGIRIYRYFFPAPLPPATVTFGRLPRLPFPEKQGLPELSLSLDITEGDLPVFADQVNVYFMPKPSANLLGLELAQEKATSLGFLEQGEQITQAIYRFNHKTTPAVLEINIVSGAFSISNDLAKDPSLLDEIPPSPDKATSIVRSYLSSGNLLAEELSGPTTYEFLKPDEFLQEDGTPFATALSQSEANFVRINLFRKSYDELPSATPDPQKANVWLMVSGATGRDKQIFAGEYHYFPVDEEQYATYPIKSAQVAWEELQAGGGYIASLGTNPEGIITIRRVYLAYYDAGVPFEFLQPIIVFEGDRDYTAYVPAVAADYYGE